MKQFTISEKRWEQLTEAMISLAKGKLDQQLRVRRLNDDFETLETLFNLVTEELRERLLHLSFVNPNEFQKYIHHFIFIVDHTFQIQKVCEAFLTHFDVDFQTIKKQSFLELIDKHTANYLKKQEQANAFESPGTKHSLILLEETCLFSIKVLAPSKTYAINLYQLHLATKNSNIHIKNRGRLQQKKRNEHLIEQVKIHLETNPISHKLHLKDLCSDFGINSNLLKKTFKEQYQCGVYEYHISLRMKHAYLLIETSTIPFKEIAQMVGYKQYSAFVNYFKSYYQILPKELRKKSSNKKQNLEE